MVMSHRWRDLPYKVFFSQGVKIENYANKRINLCLVHMSDEGRYGKYHYIVF